MQDLDRHVGDLHTFIADREIELAQELSSEVLKSSEMFVQAAELCAELDWSVSTKKREGGGAVDCF